MWNCGSGSDRFAVADCVSRRITKKSQSQWHSKEKEHEKREERGVRRQEAKRRRCDSVSSCSDNRQALALSLFLSFLSSVSCLFPFRYASDVSHAARACGHLSVMFVARTTTIPTGARSHPTSVSLTLSRSLPLSPSLTLSSPSLIASRVAGSTPLACYLHLLVKCASLSQTVPLFFLASVSFCHSRSGFSSSVLYLSFQFSCSHTRVQTYISTLARLEHTRTHTHTVHADSYGSMSYSKRESLFPSLSAPTVSVPSNSFSSC